jgi:hypothetical protein
MATSDNAELLALSGPRNPYQAGPLGVVKNGAYADLILVDGNPLENLDLVADLGKNFSLCHKRTWQWSRCFMQITCDVVLRPQLESRCQQKKSAASTESRVARIELQDLAVEDFFDLTSFHLERGRHHPGLYGPRLMR